MKRRDPKGRCGYQERHAADTPSATLPASTTISVDGSYSYVYQYNPSNGNMEQLSGTGNDYTIQLNGGQGSLLRLSQSPLP